LDWWSGPKPRTCALHMLDESCYIQHHQLINPCKLNARSQPLRGP
jgi:hypothetical protein